MKIKICGMRDPENIRRVEALDIDYMGFIFHPTSSRCILENEDCMNAIHRCKKQKVGVFVNDTPENMLEKAELYRLDILQLHGDESPETCIALRKSGYFVIKAFAIASVEDFMKTGNYSGCTDSYLFDTKCPGYGGSGMRFDWSLLDGYKGHVPFLLSGGLTPDCIHDIRLLKHLQFAGIDLNSGFELSPAVKDAERLKDFIREVRKPVAESYTPKN